MTIPPDTAVHAVRHDGWTTWRRRVFFEALAARLPVLLACARAGLSRQAAYGARRRDPGFAREWRQAQDSARRAHERAFLESLPDSLRQSLGTGAAGRG